MLEIQRNRSISSDGVTPLHESIARHFSKSELMEMAHVIDVPWDELEGETATEKAIAMIKYLERRGLLYKLVGYAQSQRPAVNWTEY